MQRHQKVSIITSKILTHRKGDPPTGASTSRPRATPRRDSGPLTNGRKSRLGVSRLARAWTGTPATHFPLVSGPIARDLTRWPALDAGGGWGRGTVRPGAGSRGVSARERRGDNSLC